MSITVSHKKRGRPPTGETPQIGVRFSTFQLAGIEAFADHEGIGRSEAIRQLVEIGLAAGSTDGSSPYSRLARIDTWRSEDERGASRSNAVKILMDYALENKLPSRSED